MALGLRTSSGMFQRNEIMEADLNDKLLALEADLEMESEISAITTTVKYKRFPFFGIAIRQHQLFLKMIVIIENPGEFDGNRSTLKIRSCEKGPGTGDKDLSTVTITNAGLNPEREGVDLESLLREVVLELDRRAKTTIQNELSKNQQNLPHRSSYQLETDATSEHSNVIADRRSTYAGSTRRPRKPVLGIVQAAAEKICPMNLNVGPMGLILDGFESFKQFDEEFEAQAQALREGNQDVEDEDCCITKIVVCVDAKDLAQNDSHTDPTEAIRDGAPGSTQEAAIVIDD